MDVLIGWAFNEVKLKENINYTCRFKFCEYSSKIGLMSECMYSIIIKTEFKRLLNEKYPKISPNDLLKIIQLLIFKKIRTLICPIDFSRNVCDIRNENKYYVNI
ncbi:hypothetical protein WA026_000169, partial [Henosepilachna vigintioctopunctata]